MEQTKTPLVSEQMRRLSSRMGNAEAYAIIQGFAADVEAIEADRQRTREVVQALCNGIETMRQGSFADRFIFADDADLDAQADSLLAVAKSQLQIEPTKR